jgi:hypothetical protein
MHDAIIDALIEKLPDVAVLPAYPDLQRSIKALPAVLLELSELEPGDDPGTGETALIGHFCDLGRQLAPDACDEGMNLHGYPNIKAFSKCR